jgi:phytoene dehydrogenase-like protein
VPGRDRGRVAGEGEPPGRLSGRADRADRAGGAGEAGPSVTPRPSDPDAVVIGAGPNGLVAANLLADAGWDVVVLEAQPEPGGGVRSAGYLGPDYVADVCSAFYPLAAASPVISSFDLEDHGLRWSHAPAVLAHPLPDGRCALVWRDLERTVAGLEELGRGDGEAWRRLRALWDHVGDAFVDALFTPFPPLRSGFELARKVRAAGALRTARLATLPVRRLAEEEFTGPGALLLAGCALHVDLAPEAAGSALYGWLLTMLGQRHGFPVPEGGAGQLTAALVHRLESRGGRLRCDSAVDRVLVRGGRAVGVRTRGGERVTARRAVLADVAAPLLYGGLVAWDHLPARLRDDMRRFQWDLATVKVDWALSDRVPWTASETGLAGTVHLSAGLDEMTEHCAQIAMGRVPSDPFVLLGQMTTADPHRSPPGTEALWGYTHVPRRVRGDPGGAGLSGRWDEGELETFAERIERQIEAFAPGFRDRIVTRHILGPAQFEAHNASAVGGAIGGGTAALHQQLVFRPTPGLGRPETPVSGLYLASASAHPGGGVHGACGTNAARAALRHERAGWRLVSGWRPAAERFLGGPP